VTDCLDGGVDFVEGLPLPSVERIRGVTPAAAQRAAGQPNEDGRPADQVGFTLNGTEDLGDFQAGFRSQILA